MSSLANKFNLLSAAPWGNATELCFSSRDHDEEDFFQVPVGLVYIALTEYFARMDNASGFAESSSMPVATDCPTSHSIAHE